MPSETDYLAAQAADAQRAIAGTISEMQRTLSDSADLAAWTREYPWSSVGLAAAVGFAAAASLTPTESDKQKKEWVAFLREALAEAEAAEGSADGAPQMPSTVSSAFSSLLGTFGGMLQSSIIAAVTAKAQQPETPSHNGHDPGAI